MAAANILTVGTTAATSSDVTVAAGDELTVGLKDAAGSVVAQGANVQVQLKDDAGEYYTVDELNTSRPVLVLSMGTWRFSRNAGVSCGVFSA